MRLVSGIHYLKPNFKILSIKERILSGVGALFGLVLSSLISWWLLGGMKAWYIAPMGASSILLFAVSASPLSQPWNVLVGNSIAAIVGVSASLYIADLTWAFSLAVGLSIFLMMSTDSLHPPSGAVAITAVLGGEAVQQLGYAFVLYPVLLNSILLLLCAAWFNRMIGRDYPLLRTHLNLRSSDPTPTQKVTIQPQDIEYALEQQTELLDISQYDLENIILQAQHHADQRFGLEGKCADIMTKDVIYLQSEDEVLKTLDTFKQLNIMSLPVVNAQHTLVGTLALSDVVAWLVTTQHPFSSRPLVKQIMHRQVITIRPEQNILTILPYFVDKSFNYLPVVSSDQVLQGIISRADMLAYLYHKLKDLHKNQ